MNKSINSILATVPIIDAKRQRGDELLFFREHHSSAFILAGGSTNGIISGPNIAVGLVNKHDLGWDLKKGLNKISDWYGEMYVIDLGSDLVLYITKPWRFNYAVALQNKSHIFNTLSIAVLSQSLGQDLKNEIFYWSLFWNYSRQMTWLIEIYYNLEKSAYLINTFGRKDMEKWLNVHDIRDIRVATWLYLLKKNHKTYAKEAFFSTSTQHKSQLIGVKHPIFSYLLQGWQGMFVTTYLKNAFSKNNGGDETSEMETHYTNEMSYEAEYIECPSNRMKYDMFQDRSIKDYYNRFIFKDASDKSSLWAYGYHTGVCYSVLVEFCKKARSEGLMHIYERDQNKSLLETVVASKILATSALKEAYGVFEHTDSRSSTISQYRGLISIDQIDAMMLETKLIDRSIIKYKEDESFYSKGIEFSKIPEITDRNYTVFEAAMIQSFIYPTMSMTTFVKKPQFDIKGRAFQMQTPYGRNINRVADYVARGLLASSANPSDIFTLKGLERNIQIQDKRLLIQGGLGTQNHMLDMSKLGDKSLADCMDLMAYAAYDEDFIGKEEKAFVLLAGVCIRNRVAIMPARCRKALDKLEKRKRMKLHLRVKDRKHVITLSEGIFGEMLREKRSNPILASSFLTAGVADNYYVTRISGAILGAFNAEWSLFGACYVYFLGVVCDLLFGRIIFVASTLSDDCQIVTEFPLSTKLSYERKRFMELTDLFLEYEDRNGKFGWNNGLVYIKHDGTDKELYTDIPAEYLGKWFMAFVFFVPKLFNQSPGGKKVGTGCVCEVMQQVTTGLGRIFTPLVRMCNVAADSPGISIHGETMSTMSKAYETSLHGGSSVQVGALMILGNMFVSNEFGLKIKDRSIRDIPELNGLFWVMPFFIQTYGLSANLARILCMAKNGDNLVLRRTQIFLNTGMLFEFGNLTKKEREMDKGSMEDFTKLEVNEDADDVNKGIGTTFMVLGLNWNRNKKALLNRTRILEVYQEEIFSNTQNVTGGVEDKVKYLQKEYGPLTMISTNSKLQNVINLVKKLNSSSFQNSRFKNSADTRIIGRMGMRKR
jgi:hypothetical protein